MKSLVLYDSLNKNTQTVAETIFDTLDASMSPELVKISKNTEIDFFDYDFLWVGSPVIDWLPTQAMMNLIKNRLKDYNRRGLIKPSAPIIPGKFGVCFGTYAGPHIGKKEALPMTMWLQSFMAHLGFMVLDTWHVVGQFSRQTELNTCGRLGNIENRPNRNDLAEVKNRVAGIVSSLEAWQ